MGGRAAEEIIYGSDHVTLGAADDIKKATQLAEQSIVTYGMYDTHNALPLKQRSDESKHKVEVQISNILTKAYKKALEILAAHESELHKLANALLEHETLTLAQIEKILKGEPI